MAYKVVRSADVVQDLRLIFDFLTLAAEEFGENTATAFDRAETRLTEIEVAMAALGSAPHQGTRDTALGKGIRHVTKGRAIFYFDLDDAAGQLRVLAAFWGGQDHRHHMLERLLDK